MWAMRMRHVGLGAFLALVLLARSFGGSVSEPQRPEAGPLTLEAGDAYRGRQFWNANATLATHTLASTKFVRFQQHTVRLGGRLVKDWLFYDERAHVNVLVRREDGRFVLFRQQKYALPRETLAPVGGYLEDGEAPLAAAKREVREELGLRCPGWRKLGSFATSANRGGGWCHLFFASGCAEVAEGKRPGLDYERQQVVELDEAGLRDALLGGEFLEVKWTATIALALLRGVEAPRGKEAGKHDP